MRILVREKIDTESVSNENNSPHSESGLAQLYNVHISSMYVGLLGTEFMHHRIVAEILQHYTNRREVSN